MNFKIGDKVVYDNPAGRKEIKTVCRVTKNFAFISGMVGHKFRQKDGTSATFCFLGPNIYIRHAIKEDLVLYPEVK